MGSLLLPGATPGSPAFLLTYNQIADLEGTNSVPWSLNSQWNEALCQHAADSLGHLS